MPKTRRRKQRSRGVTGKRKPEITSVTESKEDSPEASSSSTSAPAPIPISIATDSLSPPRAVLIQSRLKEDGEAMKLACDFRKLCSEHANASAASAMTQYLRNKFSFFGLKAPERRQLQKAFTSEHEEKIAQRTFLLEFITALWQQDERECQLYAVDLVSKYRKEILGESEEEFVGAVSCAEVLITNKSWWDTVDLVASHMVGYIVRQRRETGGAALMEEWISHSHMWLRRTALLHQLHFKRDTDQAQLFRFCLTVAHEEEFFIRKAIGWSLRQYSRTDSKAVKDFVQKNRDKFSTLSIREASKYL